MAPRRPAVTAVVTAVRPAGSHDVVSLVVPADPAWERARPGQLVVAPVDPGAGRVLPEVHWLAGAQGDRVHGTTIELLLPVERETGVGERLRILGPLGRGFAPPSQPVPSLLVAQDSGIVPLRWLVEVLRARGCPTHVVLSLTERDRGIDLGHLRRHAATVVLTSPSALAETLDSLLDDPRVDPAVVYAAAPVAVLRDTAALARRRGCAVRVAALDPAPAPGPDDDLPVVCGTGLCGACDLAVRDGTTTRVLRPCLDGPVLPGEWLLGAAPGEVVP